MEYSAEMDSFFEKPRPDYFFHKFVIPVFLNLKVSCIFHKINYQQKAKTIHLNHL